MQATLLELEAVSGPFLVCTDLNAGVQTIAPIASRVAAGGLVDLGAERALAGAAAPLRTCMGH
eukprot:3415758-Alexandrium_andersonii.AAC.1